MVNALFKFAEGRTVEDGTPASLPLGVGERMIGETRLRRCPRGR